MKTKHLKTLPLVTLFFLTAITGWTQVTIGMGERPEKGALLDLKQYKRSGESSNSDKGLLLPRVNLTALNTLEPILNSTDAQNEEEQVLHKGLTVYNVNTENGLSEGTYQWDGEKWNVLSSSSEPPFNTPIPMSRINNLRSDITTIEGTGKGEGGIDMDFSEINIPATGLYMFNVRLYGELTFRHSNPVRAIYYVSLWEEDKLIDITEVDFYISNVGNPAKLYSHSIMLGGILEEGKMVKLKIAHPKESILKLQPTWKLYKHPDNETLAEATSLIWWKI